MLACVLTSAVTALLVSSASVFADGDPASDDVPKLIPYQGTLEQDGVAFTGSIDMTFKLYDADAVDPVWEETHTVQVYGGRFAVLLGSGDAPSGAALQQAVTAADDLQLEIVLDVEGTPVPLGNKQRFVPVPYAYWTTASTDFSVARNLTVGGDASAANITAGGTVAATGNVTTGGRLGVGVGTPSAPVHIANAVSGAGFSVWDDYRLLMYDSGSAASSFGMGIEAGTLAFHSGSAYKFYSGGTTVDMSVESGDLAARGSVTANAGGNPINLTSGWQDSADGTHAEISNDTDGYQTLMVVGNKSGDGTTRRVGVWDQLDVHGDLAVTGGLTTGNTACHGSSCPGDEWIDIPGGHYWGSWRGRAYCSPNKYMCGLEQYVEDKQGDGDDTAVNDIAIICCPF